MAELNSTPQKSGSGHKRKKANLRVDLTAMVDLAFLLITFFIMTTTLAKAKAMDLTMPVGDDHGPVPASRSLTLCLGTNNKVMWYLGELKNPVIAPTITDFGKDGLRKTLVDTKKMIYDKYHKDMIVLVKPAEHSAYSNLISTLDELHITNTQIYSITDMAQADIDVLKQKAIY
jgi:biopolymer transport protein ExbD